MFEQPIGDHSTFGISMNDSFSKRNDDSLNINFRADFDYDPTKDLNFSGNNGITFHTNDILHVINAADDNWWQARRVIDGQEDPDEIGIIPSKSRVEKKERVRQKRVNFNPEKDSRVSDDHLLWSNS